MSNTTQIDSLMEQAQVFASAWSLVGSKFDNGNEKENADAAKAELRRMVEAEILAMSMRAAGLAPQMLKEALKFQEIAEALDLAEDQDADILAELERLRESDDDFLGFVRNVQAWHERQLSYTRGIQEQMKEGTKVEAGGKKFELTAREALVFQLGMEAGLASFETLPFKVSRKGDEELDTAEDTEQEQ